MWPATSRFGVTSNCVAVRNTAGITSMSPVCVLKGEWYPANVPSLARSSPTSSLASRIAVSFADPSSLLSFPPGKATCPDHGSSACSARLIRSVLGLSSPAMMTATAANLFDFISGCVAVSLPRRARNVSLCKLTGPRASLAILNRHHRLRTTGLLWNLNKLKSSH